METNKTNGTQVQNGTVKEINNKAVHNGAVAKENGIPSKKEGSNGKTEAGKQSPQLKDEKPELHKPGQPHQEEPQTEAVQIKEEAKPALNLEDKLKAVDTLHRKSVQRLNLISRMNQLEAFEVALMQEHDELEDNPYQGCKLIIEDDKKRQFVTSTPGLIRLVSQFIYGACHEKRVEIEASIVFPNA